MTWNAQLLFDGIDDGTEFKEYAVSENKWSEEKYVIRLNRLCEALLVCGSTTGMGPDAVPDIVVLQEIENARIVHDICNRLPQRNGHRYGVFVPPGEGLAFGSALISRFPVIEIKAHSADSGAVAIRPLLEVVVDVQGTPLTVFVVHWKSKTGSDEGTAIRRTQEKLLYDRMSAVSKENPAMLFVACGDFNQMPHEFALLGDYINSWDLQQELTDYPVNGTYWYNEDWEAIDQFFCPSHLFDGILPDVEQVSLVAKEPLLKGNGVPARYEVYSGAGYSDHLPLVLTIRLRE